MRGKDAFAEYHPLVNFIYFGLVILFTMFFMDPVSLVITLFASVCYHIYLKGSRAARFGLLYMLPLLLLAAAVNVLFNHEGQTILAYFPSGNPLTLESLLYGFAAACMLISVVTWFACYTEVITSDKFVYLFGRIIPALSLVLSMTLRFIPRFKEHMDAVRAARKGMGKASDNKGRFSGIREAVTVFSMTVTWSLENAIQTADSMRSRGYGLPGRTAFSIYTLRDRDKAVLLWLGSCALVIISGWMAGAFRWSYFPAVTHMPFKPLVILLRIVYFLLCMTPVFLDVWEDMVWKRSASQN